MDHPPICHAKLLDRWEEKADTDHMTTQRTAAQLTRFKAGTKVIGSARFGAGFAQADGRQRFTTTGRTVNGHLVLEGRTADKVFVPLDSADLFEVVR